VLAGALATLGVIAGIAILVVPAFIDQAGKFIDRLPHTVARADHFLGLHSGSIENAVNHFSARYTHHPLRLAGPLTTIGLSAAAIVGGLIVILISAVYMAVSPDPLVGAAIRLVPAEHRPAATQVLARVRSAWLGWLKGIGLDMIVLGSLLYGGMTLIGLDFAIGFAIFSAMMTVIPNYGSVISAVPPILLGLAQSPQKALLVFVVYIVVNQIEGNLILPIVMARTVNLHPAVVAIGVVLAGALFGILGLIISVPLISLALILIEELWVLPLEGTPVVVQSSSAGAG
jgi:predicted PurR-regulated permease PerM